jgi:DNA-binding NtrC family response regulator
MQTYSWPGNIRELQNVAQRLSFIFKYHKESDLTELIAILGIDKKSHFKNEMYTDINNRQSLKEAVAEFERMFVKQAVDNCFGDQDMAAKQLGIGRTTLWRKSGHAGDR